VSAQELDKSSPKADAVSGATAIIGDSGLETGIIGDTGATVSLDGKGADVNVSDNGVIIGGWDSVIDDSLQGIKVDEVKKMPSRLGLFWRGIKERVSIITTFDPVKKAEKRIKYAEENMKIAEYISNNAKDPKKQAWAQKRVEKANKFMEKVEKTKDKWINHPNASKRQLLKNVATHQVRKDKVLDKIEAKIPQEKLEKFRELREKVTDRSKRLVNVITNNKNISSSTLKHLRVIKNRVEEKHKELVNFQVKKRELLLKTKSGDDTAKDQLKKLQDTRKEVIKTNVERYKNLKANVKDKLQKSQIVRPAVKKTLQKVDSKIKNIVKPGVKPGKPAVKTLKPVVKPAVKKVLPKVDAKNKIQAVKQKLQNAKTNVNTVDAVKN
ncbi:MAG: hypothetical protein HQ536_05335, partial [Parcubacteria group bacterium]|nr:hypothetical protein [Parcubacteria group bacterium]